MKICVIGLIITDVVCDVMQYFFLFLSNTNKSIFYYWIEVPKSSIQLWNLTFVQGDFWDWNLNWAPRTPHTEKANVTPLVPTPPITSCWWILCFSDYAHPPPLSSLLDCSWNWSIAHLGKLICILLTTHLSSLNSWAILMTYCLLGDHVLEVYVKTSHILVIVIDK